MSKVLCSQLSPVGQLGPCGPGFGQGGHAPAFPRQDAQRLEAKNLRAELPPGVPGAGSAPAEAARLNPAAVCPWTRDWVFLGKRGVCEGSPSKTVGFLE